MKNKIYGIEVDNIPVAFFKNFDLALEEFDKILQQIPKIAKASVKEIEINKTVINILKNSKTITIKNGLL